MNKIAAILLAMGLSLAGLQAQAVNVDLGLDQTRYAAGPGGKAYLKIGLHGVEAAAAARPVLNLALVLDRSGSMSGEKLARAKDAARLAVSLLKPQDIVSLIIYDDEVEVLLPATRVSDARRVDAAIAGIEPGGSTALFAGVSRGAAEVRRYLDRNRVNRVVLLSDGQANVGPDSPDALGELGALLGREGISVSTLGLGSDYNEDLMARLATASDGNHAFIERPGDLARIFQAEFRDAMAIVALDVEVTVTFKSGVKPLRVVNRDGEIRGGQLRLKLNQVLAAQEKYILVELQLPPGKDAQTIEVADCAVNYRNQAKRAPESRSAAVSLAYSADAAAVRGSVRKDVKEQVVLQLATEANEQAVRLRDQGKAEEAKRALEANAAYLDQASAELSSPKLKEYGRENKQDADKVEDEAQWNNQRKSMKEAQTLNKTQRSY